MPFQLTYKNIKFSSQNWLKNTPVFLSDSSGKEKDSETGYHYFGARYYNSDLSLWLSVDPMSDKYPSLSPYNYCAWNPMKLVDPDGAEMDDWEIDRKGQLHWIASSEIDRIRTSSGESVFVNNGVLKRGQSYTSDNNGYLLLRMCRHPHIVVSMTCVY